MKTRKIALFAIVLFTVSITMTGCFTAALDLGAYDNTLTVINTTTKLDGGKITILVNGKEKGKVYNTKDYRNALKIPLGSGFFSNVYTSHQFSILAIGTVNNKTVAVERFFYGGTMQTHHEAWIITDGMLQPYSF